MSRLTIGEASRPRYEFRSFGQDFDSIHYRMARLSVPVPESVWERRSEEDYVVSAASDSANAKIRNGVLDVKLLEHVTQGLQQWSPLFKRPFPLPGTAVTDQLLPALGVDPSAAEISDYGTDDFWRLVERTGGLMRVRVAKLRFGYMVHNAICEYAVVHINGAAVVTVAAESDVLADVLAAVAQCGMGDLENISYVEALKRVVGITPLPLANEHFRARMP